MKYLPIYLNDHYAGATAGAELAKRTAKSHRGDAEFGPSLSRLAAEIAEDRETLKQIMERLGVSEDRLKTSLFWVGEKAGRLKLNGHLLQPSPMSRLVEIEGLIGGVSGKLSLWRTLLELVVREPRLDEPQLDALARRAEDQLSRLHALRGAAGLIAFRSDIP